MSIDVTGDRFFTQYTSKKTKEDAQSEVIVVDGRRDHDADTEMRQGKKKAKDINCLCYYYCKKCMPFRAKPAIWETSQNDIFELNDVEDTGYPLILRLLENKFFDALFITTSLWSVLLYFLSEGFLMESTTMWAIIHLVNVFYTLCVIINWLKIFIRSKRAKTNQGYTMWDVIFTLCTVFPTDIIAMIFYSMKQSSGGDSAESSTDLFVTFCRIHYVFRIRNILQYFSMWEDKLLIADFPMFFLRTLLWVVVLLNLYASIYHRAACDSFSPKHFKMTVVEATEAVCHPKSWLRKVLESKTSPLLKHEWNVLALHYCISLYRAVDTAFLLGYGDMKTNLQSDWELGFSAVTEITAWIFTLVFVSGTLTSLFIEKDTEREEFLTRKFAIERYLDFNPVGRKLKQEVLQFYDYLWKRSRGVVQLDLIETLPISIRAEVFYNINKFVLDKLPLLAGLDDSFLMNLSMHMDHTVHLAGEILFRKDEIGTQVYYLIKGHLEVMDDDETHVLTTIRSGSILGEIFLLHSYLHIATVRCATECVMMEITKEDFNEVLQDYPDYREEFQKRIEHRFAQSALLLSLCEKQNQYIPHVTKSSEKINIDVFGTQQNFQNVSSVLLLHKDIVETEKHSQELGDLDGLKLKNDVIAKLQAEVLRRKSYEDEKPHARRETSVFKALELDVNRASSLAKDLGISIAPIIISAPEEIVEVSGSPKKDTATVKSIFLKVFPQLKGEKRTWKFHVWKLIVCLSALIVSWYYPYRFAYRKTSDVYIDYIFNMFDGVFAIDFLFETIQIVVTPKRSIENIKEILSYRAKTAAFYIHFFAFFPLEFIFAPMFGWEAGKSAYYYLLKFNRLIQFHHLTRVMNALEISSKLPVIVIFLIRCLIRLFYITHCFAVIYAFLQRDIIGSKINVINYGFAMYWAAQIVTSAGFGDIPYVHDSEVALLTIGLIFGTVFLLYMGAKMASILANSERRRVSFKRVFFQVQSFMTQRKLSNSLKLRVSTYYNMLWLQNEGVLIPSQDSPMWDAPNYLQTKVAVAQALKFVARIPLTKYLPVKIQRNVCKALRQYCVPPGETVLHPDDRSRELFIIIKGFVDVQLNGVSIGALGVGRYFGTAGLIYGEHTNLGVITLTHCQFFCLNHGDLMTVLLKDLRFELDYRFLRNDQSRNVNTKKSKQDGSNSQQSTGSKSEKQNDEEIPNFEELIDQLKESFPDEETLSAAQMSQPKMSNGIMKYLTCQTISPHGRFLKWWTFFRVFAAVIVSCFTPAQAVFTFNPLFCVYFMLLLDVIAWVDLYVMMHVKYYGTKNQVIKNVFETAKHYLKGSFIIDLLACFPLEFIIFILYPEIHPFSSSFNYDGKYHLVTSLRLNRVIQVYRMLLAGRVLEKSIFRSLSLLILIEVIPLLILFVNGVTCLCAFLVCEPPVDREPMKCSDTAWLTHGDIYNYQVKNKFIDNPAEYFLVGWYWVMNSVMAVGFGDIRLLDDYNRNIGIFVTFFGLMTTGFLASKLTACMAGEDSRKLEIREKAKIIFNFLEQYKTSRSCRSRVREHYFSAWDKTKGISVGDLFAALHPTLKADVMKELYESHLRKSPLFEDLDEPGIRMLSLSLKESYYPEGEFVMKYGDLNDDIFMICSGVVVGYTAQGKIIGYMGTGSLLGEISALYDIQRLYTAVTATGVDLFVFNKTDFIEFLRVYPEIHLKLEQGCLMHYRQTVLEITNVKGSVWEEDDTDIANLGFTLDNEVIGSNTKVQTSATFPNNPTETKVLKISEEDQASRYATSEAMQNLQPGIDDDDDESDDDSKQNADINDPLRVLPLTAIDHPDTAKNELANAAVDLNNHWYNWILTFGKKTPRDEMGLIHIIQDKKKFNLCTFVIHPSSYLCSCVSVFLTLTAISCGLTAYEMSFGTSESTNQQEGTTVLLVIKYSLEVFFIIRIIGSFHLGYYNDKGVLVDSARNVSLRYIRRLDGLVIDLLSTIPFYQLAYIWQNGSEADTAANIRCLQLLRMILFVRYLNESGTDLRMKASNVKIFKVTILLCFAFHFCACSWYLVSCSGSKCNPRSWIDILVKEVTEDAVLSKSPTVTVGNHYLLALNYVANTITFSGLSDMTARLTMEIVMTIMIIFATVFVMGYLLGEMTQCLSSQVSSKIHFQHKLSFLENHLNTLGLKQENIIEVRDYFKLMWSSCRALQYHEILGDLPYPLRADILFEIYGPSIKKSRLLRKLDDEVIRQICVKVRHEMYMAGTRIVRVGNVVNTMQILTKGEVVVLDEDKNTDICITKLVEGNCFGEMKMFIPDSKYSYSYTARLETEIGVISREDLFDVLKKYPMLTEELQTLAKNIVLQRQTRLEEDKKRFFTSTSARISAVNLPNTTIEPNMSQGRGGRFIKQSPSLQEVNFVTTGADASVSFVRDNLSQPSKRW